MFEKIRTAAVQPSIGQVDKQVTFIPLQVGVMSGQNIFHQGDSCVVGFFSKLLGKVEFSTQEVSNWPQPLLLMHTKYAHRNIYWHLKFEFS